MATLNTRIVKNNVAKETTFEGAKAVTFNEKKQLERAVLSTLLWENTFYENGVAIADRISNLVKTNKVEDVIEVALNAKFMAKLRHIPLFVIRELFRRKEARLAAGTVLSELITRPDDATEFLAMWWKDNKDEPLAKQAKKALAESLSKFDVYQLQKYKKENSSVSLRDVFRLVHPKPKTKEQADMWGKVVNQSVGTADTWETALSAGANKKETFERLSSEKKLGGLALLRNLRNMKQSGMDIGEIKKLILSIKTDKLFPTQLISAYRHNIEFAKELETLFLQLFTNRPRVKGSTAVLVDISGSMVGAKVSSKSEIDRLDAATGLAAIAREMFEDIDVFSFDTSCRQIPATRGFSLMEAIKRSGGGGTNIGLAIEKALSTRKYDRIIVITDEQSSDTVSELPFGTKGYMMNVAQYQNGVGYGNCWTRIDGWSDNVLDYIIEYEKFSQQD